MGDVPASQMSVVKSTDGLSLSVYPSTQIRYLLLNTSKEPFNDPAVRKALAYGINKAEMAEVVYGEYGAAVASVLSESHGKFYNTDLQVIPYQPEDAKKMLADAGYPDGITFTMNEGRSYITYASWMTFYPGLLLCITGVGLSLLGDAATDILRTKGR